MGKSGFPVLVFGAAVRALLEMLAAQISFPDYGPSNSAFGPAACPWTSWMRADDATHLGAPA